MRYGFSHVWARVLVLLGFFAVTLGLGLAGLALVADLRAVGIDPGARGLATAGWRGGKPNGSRRPRSGGSRRPRTVCGVAARDRRAARPRYVAVVRRGE